MKRRLIGAALAFACMSAYAAPQADFASALGPTAAARTAFNGAQNDSAVVDSVNIDAFLWNSATDSYSQDNSFLWVRNEPHDHGVGVCSSGENCGPLDGTGSGDWNELSNEANFEVIRLHRTVENWSQLWVSSLDAGGSGDSEMGTFFFSNDSALNLDTAVGTSFSYTGGSEEKMIWSGNNGSDYVYFIAGPNPAGTNNDYLV